MCQASRTQTDHQCQLVSSSPGAASARQEAVAGCPSPAGLCCQCAMLGTLVTDTSTVRVGEPGRSLSSGPSKCVLSLGSRAHPLTHSPGAIPERPLLKPGGVVSRCSREGRKGPVPRAALRREAVLLCAWLQRLTPVSGSSRGCRSPSSLHRST